MFSFFSSHYEKVILASLLVVFAVLLVWQVNFLQAAQTREVEAIINKAEPMTDQVPHDFTQAKYAAETIFSGKVAWTPVLKGPTETDLFVAYHLSLCPFCFNLIPSNCFPEKGDAHSSACPISSCHKNLLARQKRIEKKEADLDLALADTNNDVNNNGVPDDWEKENKVFSENPEAINQDPDGDHFSTYEEFVLKTDPCDPKSHPAYIDYQYVKSLKKTPITDLYYRGLMAPSGKDMKQWEINIEFREGKRRAKTRQFKLDGKFDHMGVTFQIIGMEPDDPVNPGNGTVIYVRRDKMDEKIRCETGKTIYDPVETLYMRNAAYKKTIRCQVGKTFTLGEPRTGVNVYRVISATGTSAVVKDEKSGAEYALVLDADKPVVAPREDRGPGVNEAADMGRDRVPPDGLAPLDIPAAPAKSKNKRTKDKVR